MGLPLLIATAFIVIYGVKSLLSYRRGIASIGNLPGPTYLLWHRLAIATITRKIKYIWAGENVYFHEKHERFAQLGLGVFALKSIFPTFQANMVVADASLMKKIMMSRSRFPKAIHHYDVVNFFGRNVLSVEGEEWKKFRKICAPAFNDRNNTLVWSKSIETVGEMFKLDLWKDQAAVDVNHGLDITMAITLFIISSAGFGRDISWTDDLVIPQGHTMTFKEALNTVSETALLKLAVPDMLMGLTKKTRKCREAFAELRVYMAEMIHERRRSEKTKRYDLLSSLLEANSDELDVTKMTDDELIGNVYIFLLAGHETTAHTLCFALALLALYPDEQEKLFEHIKSVIPDRKYPTYEQMPLLTHTLAVLYETLRMFPSVPAVPKVSTEDTVLTTEDAYGVGHTIPIPKGTDIELSIVGLQYNPRHWDNPFTFDPSRFLKQDWPRDAFYPFSGGPRACIGRKFAETSSVAILTMLVMHYKITVLDDPQFANETFEQRKAKVLSTHIVITLTPNRVPLRFTRRT